MNDNSWKEVLYILDSINQRFTPTHFSRLQSQAISRAEVHKSTHCNYYYYYDYYYYYYFILFFYFFIFFIFFYFIVYITIFSNFSFGCSISLWLFKRNAEAFCELWLGKWGKRYSTGVNQPLEPFNFFMKFPLTCFFSWWISPCPPYPPCEQVFSCRAQNV